MEGILRVKRRMMNRLHEVLSRLERLASTDLEATELFFSIVSHLLDTMFDSMLEGMEDFG